MRVPQCAMDQEQLHRRARERGVNRWVLFVVRMVLTPFFLIYLRMQRIGREHIPAEGPVILASNHRSFFDPFVIGTMTRRPVYYVAKQELFMYNRAAELGAERARRVPGGAGCRRPGHDRDGEDHPRPGRDRADVPRGHAHAPGPARQAAPGRRAARAGDGRAGRADRDHRHRGHSQGMAVPAAQGQAPSRPAAALPQGGQRVAGARRRRHRPHLADGHAPVGMARRPAPDPPRRDHRRRRLGHKPRGAAGARRPRGRARHAAPASRRRP